MWLEFVLGTRSLNETVSSGRGWKRWTDSAGRFCPTQMTCGRLSELWLIYIRLEDSWPVSQIYAMNETAKRRKDSSQAVFLHYASHLRDRNEPCGKILNRKEEDIADIELTFRSTSKKGDCLLRWTCWVSENTSAWPLPPARWFGSAMMMMQKPHAWDRILHHGHVK